MNTRHIDVLAPHDVPTIVLMGPRLRCNRKDYNVLEYSVADLKKPTLFRVSGMITGPEEFIERIAPDWGHYVEVWGPDRSPQGMAKRTSRRDDYERDAASLIDAHALWVFTLEADIKPDSKLLDYEMVLIAQELGVPVFLFLPETMNYEVLEL